jgi:NADH:ubiquinone oxidoreductase subunit 5 (subunit L)/multisubunit Na+/H+ antiporter MnhA subunit
LVRTIMMLFVLLALGVGIILLQIYLSRKENRWSGLVLPIISFCISLIAVFNVAAYTTNTLTGVLQVTDESGVVVQEEVVPATPSTIQRTQNLPALIFTIGSVLLLYNIPTAVLLAIYFGCREKQRQRTALNKMQAQDLE